MTWVTAGVAAAGIAASLYSSNEAENASYAASKKNEGGIEGGVAAATQLLTPYIQSSDAANRQLMIEMGLGSTLREQDLKDISGLESQILALQNAPAPQIKKKKKGGLLGSITGATLGGLFSDPITGAILGGVDGKKQKYSTGSYEGQIAELQAQLAEKQGLLGDESAYEQTNAYMNAPGYQGAIQAGTEAVNQGAANDGALYSGSRGNALKEVGQSVQQSYYNNYINMLSNMANPSTATNLANINIGAAGNIGSNNIAATNLNNQNQSAMIADIMGGLTSAGSAYINRPQQTSVAPPDQANANQQNYSSYV